MANKTNEREAEKNNNNNNNENALKWTHIAENFTYECDCDI